MSKYLKPTIIVTSLLLYFISLMLPALRTVGFGDGTSATSWSGWSFLVLGFLAILIQPLVILLSAALLANLTFIYSVYSYACNKFKRAFISGGISILLASTTPLYSLSFTILHYLPGFYCWLAAFILITISSYLAMIKNK